MIQLYKVEDYHLLIMGDGKVSLSVELDKKSRDILLDMLLVEEAKDLSKDV